MSEENLLKKTPVYHEHLALGAKMVEFSGWSMPVFYSKITEETFSCKGPCRSL